MSEEENVRAKRRAMYLLGAKPYSEQGLYKKLLENYPQSVCESVVSLMKEYGYLDDREYARRYSHHLICTKHFGKRKAFYEMKMKGLDDEIIREALGEYDDEEICGQITELLRKKYAEKLADREQRQKVTAALARRGYSFSDIKAAIEQVLREDYE